MCFVTLRDEEPLPVRTTTYRQSPSSRIEQESRREIVQMREERREPTVYAPSSVSRAPTRVSRAPTRVSRATSRPRSTTRSAYVEVDRESSVSSNSSGKKSRRPYSEYSMHEREYRRAVRQPEYETYRYIEPRSDYLGSSKDDYQRSNRGGRRVDETLRISMSRDRR